jgi:hypothetical protein
VVTVGDDNCASAVYSRPGEAYILVGNLDGQQKNVTCKVNPRNLPYPLFSVSSGEILNGDKSVNLNIDKLTGNGEDIALPGDSVVLVRIK